MRLRSLGLLTVLGPLVAGLPMSVSQCGGGDDSPSRLRVGAAVVSILPEVDGSTAYFDSISDPPLAMEPGDSGMDPGVFVEEWDVGTIPVGNGETTSHWVHDDIRAGAVAFRDLDQPDGKTLVMVSVDVYMLFRQDIEEIYSKVKAQVGEDAFSKLWIVVSATHNHMGPDTSGMSGPMNHAYYNYMTTRIASAVVQALDEDNQQPALVKFATSSYQFGTADIHAPYIADPTLNSLQVVNYDDPSSVIATLFQWQSHPEDTLGFGEEIYATDAQAEYLKSIDECHTNDDVHCHVEGQFLSSGFAGYATWKVMEETGAPALFFNGPIGGLASPIYSYVWETEGAQGQPAGDGLVVPDNAVLIDTNFHKQAVNGLELGKRVLSDLAGGETVADPSISVIKKEFYTRLSNLGFRIGLSVKPTGQPLVLGHLKRDLFTCPVTGPKDDSTCVSDNYESVQDPILGLPVRVGEFGKTEALYIKLGPAGMMTIPGEAVVEVVQGLPSDFVSDPRNAYFVSDSNRANHVPAAQYDTNGYVRQAMTDRYKWALGLTQDELGYMIPISDWRIYCTADEEDLGGTAGTCAALHAAGIVEYQDYDTEHFAISGNRCKSITEDPSLLQSSPFTDYPSGGELAQQSCRYGQTWNDADGHYEETNASSWDFAKDWTETVKSLTGWEGELEDVNPDFISENLKY